MAKQTLKVGSKYSGPKAIFSGPEVGHVLAHYALDKKGRELLLKSGKPVRLVQIDLAPGDFEDGSEEFRVAGPDDPPQRAAERVVDFQPENVHTNAKVGI